MFQHSLLKFSTIFYLFIVIHEHLHKGILYAIFMVTYNEFIESLSYDKQNTLLDCKNFVRLHMLKRLR